MALLTVEQLRANDSYIYGDATRYTVFERGDNLKETKNPPSLLLLLRNIDFDPSNINIDRLVNQIRQILRYDGAGLKQFDFDLVRGERRALWGNSQAQGFLNQANAAILKIQSLINKYEDRKEAHNQQAWFIRAMIDALGVDYTNTFGTQRETFDQILKWMRSHLAARFRHLWQTNKMDSGGRGRPRRLEFWGTDCNRQVHEGALLEDAILALSGRFVLLDDRERSTGPTRQQLRERTEEYQNMFQNIYFYSVEEAIALVPHSASSEKDGLTNDPGLADIFAWIVEYIDNYMEWYSITIFEIYPSRIRAAARQALGPIWAAFENIRQDVLIALNQRRLYGGITAYIWSRILGKIDTLTNLVRALVSITYVENDGQIKTWEIRFAHWTVKHGTTPATSFPGIRDPPGLSRASTATNVPPELDGGGPGPGPGEGGGGGNNDGGDSDNDDDNNNDNNNPGVNIWDDTQFDYNPGVNTNTNNNNNANINNNNNDNVNNDADEDDNDDDEDEDDDQDQDTYNLSGDEDSSDSDNDGYGGGGGAGGAAGGTTGGGLGGGGGGGGNIYVPPGRRTGGGVPPGPWMNRNWRDRSSAMVCKRCVQISGEEECPTCGGESTAIYPPAKGRKMQMKLKRAQENDGEIDSPNKRIRSLLASQVMIDRLSDELRVAKLNIREGPGTSMETMNFDYPDSFKQRGPEFQLPPKIGG